MNGIPTRKAEGNPWDARPAESRRGRLAAWAFLVISLALGVVTVAWPVLLVTRSQVLGSALVPPFLFRWIALLVAAFLCFRLYDVSRTCSGLHRLEKECASKRIALYFRSVTLFRSFRGPGTITFREADMRLTARLSLDFLLLLPVSLVPCILAAFALPELLASNAGAMALTAPASTLLILGLCSAFGRRLHPIIVRPQDLQSVHCDGPFVRLFFVFPPVRRLRTISLFVCADREKFFRGFNTVFPGALPPSYAKVLQRYEIA